MGKENPPFRVGDVVEVNPKHADILTNVPRVITKIWWVGLGHSQSGWLVNAESKNPQLKSHYDLTRYDSGWFVKA